MVLCKFYQQGNCRYGDRCRYEHPRGGGNYNNNTNTYKWYGDGRGGGSNQGGGRGGKGVTFKETQFSTQNRFESLAQPDNRSVTSKVNSQLSHVLATSPHEILGSIAGDMTTWEESTMWNFSCYSYWKDGACIPGLDDVSPEEMRLEAYTAQKSGNIQAYVLKVNDMVNKFRQLRTELIRPSMQTKQKLIQFLGEEKIRVEKGISPHPSSAVEAFGSGNTGFGSMSTTSSASEQSASLFGKSSSTTGQSIFGGSSSAFGQSASSTSQQPSFANLATPVQSGSAGNIFGGITSFGAGSGFGSSQSPAGIFGNVSEKTTFGSTVAPTGQTTFGSTEATTFGSGGTVPFGSSSGATNFGSSSGATPFGSGGGATPFGSGGGATPFGSGGGATPFGSTGGATPFTSTSATTSFGGTAASQPGQPLVASQNTTTSSRSSVYTPLEELTAEEREQFEAARFTPGKLPTRPPPRELCS